MGNCVSTTSSHTLNPEPPKTPLFTNSPTESTIYRIPALIYVADTQTFLAFAEKRTSPADVDATFLVMRRGTQQNGSIQWEEIMELTSASLDGYRSMNPCPVYEKGSKTVFLFFNSVFDKVTEQQQICSRKNRARLCYVKSTDSGKTWSRATDLTENVIGSEIKNWATFSVGPGHGIQMTDGRLIIPAYCYYIHCCSIKPHAFAFYSDDRGDKWDFGQRLSVETIECEMAEITDGKGKSHLYCNARNPQHCSSSWCCWSTRVEAWSENGGMDFDTVLYSDKLVETQQYKGCQGSVVSFTHGNETWLLFSHPTDRKERKDLGVYWNKSPLSASGWNEPRIINPGVSGYSDLTQSNKNDGFAVLMERGTSNLEEIVFAEFSLRDIKNQ